jgi:16S rRNA (guanine527-N7)-methyltransferase
MVSASDNAFGFILNVPYTDHCMEPAPSADCLNEMLITASLSNLQITQYKQLNDYLSLILRWNTRTNLTSVRDPEAILSRHFVESIACAQALPPGINTLLDFGSGAGFPGIPIAICRPDLAVTLAESQGKKAAFLQEAGRVTGVTAKVHAGRAELLTTQFDCVTLRAVDHMDRAVKAATHLISANGWLALLTTQSALPALQTAAGSAFVLSEPVPLPGSDNRILALARKP